MGNFDPAKYAPVDDRIAEFYTDWPMGSIRTRVLGVDEKSILVQARCYRTIEEARDGIYTSGIAHEVQGSGPVNRTNHVENAECVPLTVPALARCGWRYYHQLTVGDEVLAYDVAGGVLFWDRIQALTVYPDQSLVRIGNTRFHADCTPDHRWVVNGRLQRWNEVTAKANGKIRLTARFRRTETAGCADAARLGWLFGDCTLKYVNGLVSGGEIAQSKPEHFGVLKHLFGQPRQVGDKDAERHWPSGRTSVCLEAFTWAVPAAEVRRVLGLFRVNDASDLPAAVLGMTSEEADAFLDSMMRSDGSRGIYGKTCLHRCAAVQLAMFITGHATGDISERTGNAMTKKPCYTVSMHRKGEKYLSEFTTINIPPQDVWCPTTSAGTWVGRFSGRPAITGNTSAIGRALANLGYSGAIDGKRAPRPSREEMQKVERAQAAHSVALAWIRDVADRCDDGVEMEVRGGASKPIKEVVREAWVTVERDPNAAARLVRAIEAATGQTFNP